MQACYCLTVIFFPKLHWLPDWFYFFELFLIYLVPESWLVIYRPRTIGSAMKTVRGFFQLCWSGVIVTSSLHAFTMSSIRTYLVVKVCTTAKHSPIFNILISWIRKLRFRNVLTFWSGDYYSTQAQPGKSSHSFHCRTNCTVCVDYQPLEYPITQKVTSQKIINFEVKSQ